MAILPKRKEDADHTALELVSLTHTKGAIGPVNGPPLDPRVLGIFHLAIHDAYFAINRADHGTNLDLNYAAPYKLPDLFSADDARQAVAGAAITGIRDQYSTPNRMFARSTANQASDLPAQHIKAFSEIDTGQPLDTLSSSYRFGVAVGKAMLDLLAIKPGDPNMPGTNQGDYNITPGKFKFNDDPSNPVRRVPVDVNDSDGPQKATRVYHAPFHEFHGMTAERLAVQHKIGVKDVKHIIADPPVGRGEEEVFDYAEHQDAFRDIIRMGGVSWLSSTKRRPFQTAAA